MCAKRRLCSPVVDAMPCMAAVRPPIARSGNLLTANSKSPKIREVQKMMAQRQSKRSPHQYLRHCPDGASYSGDWPPITWLARARSASLHGIKKPAPAGVFAKPQAKFRNFQIDGIGIDLQENVEAGVAEGEMSSCLLFGFRGRDNAIRMRFDKVRNGIERHTAGCAPEYCYGTAPCCAEGKHCYFIQRTGLLEARGVVG